MVGPSRTAKQVRSHGQKHFEKMTRKGFGHLVPKARKYKRRRRVRRVPKPQRRRKLAVEVAAVEVAAEPSAEESELKSSGPVSDLSEQSESDMELVSLGRLSPRLIEAVEWNTIIESPFSVPSPFYENQDEWFQHAPLPEQPQPPFPEVGDEPAQALASKVLERDGPTPYVFEILNFLKTLN